MVKSRGLRGAAIAFLVAGTVFTFQNCGKFRALPNPEVDETAALFTSLSSANGQYTLSWYLPDGGGALSTSNYFFTQQVALQQPDCSGPSTVTPYRTSIVSTLNLPEDGQSVILSNGQFAKTSTQATFRVSCSGTGYQKDYLATDEQTALYSIVFDNAVTTPLTGGFGSTLEELNAAIPVKDWIGFNYLTANGKWLSGSAYTHHQGTPVADYVDVQDCFTMMSPSGLSPQPCMAAAATITFPITIYGDSSKSEPSEYYNFSDGQLTTFQGLTAWVSSSPLPLSGGAHYRVFFILNGYAYKGRLIKAGQHIVYSQADGSYVDYTVTLNAAAVESISANFIAGAVGVDTGSTSEVPTQDQFGLGAHGVNGSLAPQDLVTHYSLPSGLTGAGQTIAIIDAPASGDLFSDLNTMSQAYGLPTLAQCPSTSGPCFQHIDQSNGKVDPNNDWTVEPALDLQAIHAVAPNANLLLITAADSGGNSLFQAVLTAAKTPGVVAISMSFNDGGVWTDSVVDQLCTAYPGLAFFGSTGDSGSLARSGFPAASPCVTAVGGTRIRALNWTSTASETAWTFTGGGYSGADNMPAWQSAYLAPLNLVTVNQNMRAMPDVAAVADAQNSPFAVYYKQAWLMTGGTSLSAPLWAGFTALLAENLVKKGTTLSTVITNANNGGQGGGFNTLLYNARETQGSKASFNDVISGSNDLGNIIGGCTICSAGPGFNDLTGLGVPNVTNLIQKLSPP